MTDEEVPTMDTERSQGTIHEGALETADRDRQVDRAGRLGPAGAGSSRARRLLKRAVLVLGSVVLVAVLGVAAWLAPLVMVREDPQPAADAEPLEPTGHIDVGGAQLPYLERGAGPPVLLVHGGGSGLREFEAVAAVLAGDHRVITYSRRGYEGAGEPVTADDPLPYVDAAAVLEALDAEGAVVAGHSSGAGMATRLAQERPDLVSGLVALDPAFEDDVPLGFLRVILAVQVRGWFMSDERAPVPVHRWVLTHDDGYSPWDEDPAITDELKHRWLSAGTAPLAELQLLDAAGVEFFPREGLDALDVPVTLVGGERSRPHYHSAVDTLEEEIPGAARSEVPEVGHGMQHENPAAVAEAIRQAAQAALDDAHVVH